jgi:hypothetical protein
MKKRFSFPFRIGITTVVIALTCLVALVACQQDPKQSDSGMQYFFSGKVIEAENKYLLIQVNDIGNTNLSMDDKVEVSTDVVSTDDCPDLTVGKYAKVLMAKNIDEDSLGRLEALSIYEVDETGGIVTE